MPTFSQSLEQSLHRALAIANERHHQYATLEHLLLSLIDDADAAAVMRACSVDLDKLRTSLVNYLETEFENLVTDGADDAKPTAGFQRVIQRAVIHVQSSGREEVTGANVLIAIFAERESHAAYFLQEQDMTRYDAVNYISHGIAKRPGVSEARPVRGVDEETETKGNEDSKKKGEALETYCVNLNKKARDGKIDPVIGRNAEINRAIQVLCRRQKNNLLAIDDMGLGLRPVRPGRGHGPAGRLEAHLAAVVLQARHDRRVRLADGGHRQPRLLQGLRPRAQPQPVLPPPLDVVGQVQAVAERPAVLPGPAAVGGDRRPGSRPCRAGPGRSCRRRRRCPTAYRWAASPR